MPGLGPQKFRLIRLGCSLAQGIFKLTKYFYIQSILKATALEKLVNVGHQIYTQAEKAK